MPSTANLSSLAHPSPATWFAGNHRPSRLQPCLTLALLLHVWLVLLVGSTPGGSARPGEGVWGRLNVSLDLGGMPAEHGGSSPPAPPLPKRGAVGEARRERFGGAVRSEAEAAAAPATPGAARLGRWQAQAAEPLRGRPEPLAALPQPGLAELDAVDAAPPEAPPPVLRSLAAPSLARPEAAALAPARPSQATEALPRFDAPELAVPAAVTRRTPDAAPQLERPAHRASLPATLRPEAAPDLPRFDAPSLPAAAATQPGVGAPDAGARLGQDVATAPSAPASAPKLDLEWRRPRGGEISRQGSAGVLQLLAHPPERKSKLSESLENAAKKDCREAYSGAGVLAAVPLLLDAARDKGCRW